MEVTKSVCEICGAQADEKQKRHENWIEFMGGSLNGISIWLEKPRMKDHGLMLCVGFQDRHYHFCSIACLTTALKSKESI